MDLKMLEDNTAAIYAAGGAIGGAVARAFVREGARLFLTGRNAAKLDAVARDLLLPAASPETAQLDALDERAGGVDISFNASGPGPAPERRPLTQFPDGGHVLQADQGPMIGDFIPEWLQAGG